MIRYFIKLAYKGGAFHGWQRQLNGITVQQVLEEAMSLIMRETVSLTGAGRTDTGVHANEYFAHFDSGNEISAEELKKLIFRFNAYLPEDIAIYDIFPVPAWTHARFSAVTRTYQYCISTRKNPFRFGFYHFLYGKIDLEIMNRGGELLTTYNDFTSFSKVDTDTKTNICKLYAARWEQIGDELVFTIQADRFLRNMVRAIVGTLLQLGMGKISLEELREIIESLDRSKAGDSVPACGLYLVKIDYPSGSFTM